MYLGINREGFSEYYEPNGGDNDCRQVYVLGY
jgi:hypothetical protein